MTASEYRLYLLDGTRVRAAELDDFTLRAVLRFNQPGTWQVTTRFAGEAPDWLRFGGYGSGIALTRDGQTVLLGLIEDRLIEESEAGIALICSGRDALALLEDRWVDPMGGSGGPTDYSGASHDSQTGVASTIMRYLVNVNLISGSRVDRRMPAITLDPGGDPVIGGSATINARFDNLLTLLQSIASTASPSATGLGFRMVDSPSVAGRLEFEVYEPRDLRETITFDRRLHNVARAQLREFGPTVNALVMGGQGVAENRQLTEFVDSSSISRYARRIERFVDRRDTDDLEAHAKKAAEVLQAGDGGFEYTLDEVIDDAPYRWGRDYDLGDRVTIYVAGVRGEGVVREISLTIDGARGVHVTPLIGTAGVTFSPPQVRQIERLGERVAFLERTDSFGSIGMMMMWRRDPGEIPVGWRLCDGSTVSGYATLDMRGRFPIGVSSPTYTLGGSGGASDHAHGGGDLLMEHTHEFDLDHNHGNSDTGNAEADSGGIQFASGGVSHQHQFDMPALGTNTRDTAREQDVAWSGSSQTVSHLPPWRAVHFIERVSA